MELTNHKDALGRPIAIGDLVVVARTKRSSVHFQTFKVVKTTTSMVMGKDTKAVPYRCIVITEQSKANLTNYPEYFI